MIGYTRPMTDTTKKPLKTQNLLYVGIALGAFFLLDPFGLFSPQNASLPTIDDQTYAAWAADVERTAVEPSAALIEAASAARITYIAEFMGVADQAAFTAGQIPALVRDAGVRIIGLWFLLASDQPSIDRFMAQSFYDEAAANDLLFSRSPIIAGFVEYRDILKAAWEAGRAGYPVRLLGMNLLEDFSQIQSIEDLNDPQKVASAYPEGLPDEFMARVATAALAEQPEARALFYITLQMSMPGFVNLSYRNGVAELGFADSSQFAFLLSQAGYTDATVVTFHGPWSSTLGRLGAWYPAGGLLDSLFARMAVEQKLPALPFAFRPADSALAQIPLRGNQLTAGYGTDGRPELKLGDLFQVYVVTSGISSLKAMQAIPDLVTDRNVAEAARRTPLFGKPEDVSAQFFNDQIRKLTDQWTQILQTLSY